MYKTWACFCKFVETFFYFLYKRFEHEYEYFLTCQYRFRIPLIFFFIIQAKQMLINLIYTHEIQRKSISLGRFFKI